MNTLFLDQRYADMLSPYIQGFTLKSSTPYRVNCRCPLCGDSQKNKSKKRGWILQSKDSDGLVYYCHNCNASMPFGKFLPMIDGALTINYEQEIKKEYIETLGKQKHTIKEQKPDTVQKTKFKIAGTSRFLKKVSSLPSIHPVKRYVQNRAIPPHQHHRIYYCQDFTGWINTIMPDRLPVKKDPRLVMPFGDGEGNVVGVTARTLLKNVEPRYITIMFDETKPKTYGLDKVEWRNTYYVVEGAMDSFFLPNCLAINGSAIDFSILKNPEMAVFVLDNQPRDKGVVKTMKKVIDAGMRVVVWPTSPMIKEDINDIVKKGIDPMTIIRERTFGGLAAEAELYKWRRTNTAFEKS